MKPKFVTYGIHGHVLVLCEDLVGELQLQQETIARIKSRG
jgi:hypothetical protein